MKKTIIHIMRLLSICLLLPGFIVIPGCNNDPVSNFPIDMENVMKGELSIYYVDNNGGAYGEAQLVALLQEEFPDLTINATSFPYNDFMPSVMTELNAGGGPDLFLLERVTEMSFDKMSRNGTYLDLTPYLENDASFNPDNYYTAAIEAGKINGKQYILPLSFSPVSLFTTQEKLDEIGVSLTENTSWEQLLETLSTAVDKASLNPEYIPIAAMINRKDYPTFLLRAFGAPIVDMDKGQIVLDKDDFRTICDFVKKWEPYSDKVAAYTINDNSQAYSNVGFYITNQSFYGNYYNIKQVDSLLGQDSFFTLFPSYKNPSEYTGTFLYYTAVNSNSSNKLLAYNAGRALMDLELTTSDVMTCLTGSIPIRKSILKNYLNASSATNMGTMIDGELVTYRYDEETNQKILNIIEKTQNVVVDDVNIDIMIWDCMKDYTTHNTRTFDECWDDLVNRLTLYINE